MGGCAAVLGGGALDSVLWSALRCRGTHTTSTAHIERTAQTPGGLDHGARWINSFSKGKGETNRRRKQRQYSHTSALYCCTGPSLVPVRASQKKNIGTIATTVTTFHNSSTGCSHLCQAISQARQWATGTTEGNLLCTSRLISLDYID